MKSKEIKESLIAIKNIKKTELVLIFILVLINLVIFKYPNLLMGGYDANGNQTNYITFLYVIIFAIIIAFLYLRISLINHLSDLEKNIE